MNDNTTISISQSQPSAQSVTSRFMIQCPRCGEFCQNKNVYALHQLGEHHCYKEGTDIALKLRNDITKLRGAVEYILYREPGTRGGDDVQLEHWYHCFFTHREYYDPQLKAFIARQQGPVQVGQAHFMTKQDTLARRRREIQQEDQELYHEWYLNEKGKKVYTDKWRMNHECLCGGPQAQLRRYVQEQEHHDYYSGGV